MNYEIYYDGKLMTTIWASEAFTKQYCNDNGFTYRLRSAPAPSEPEPSEMEDLGALLVDQEYRLTLLELGVTGPCFTECSSD